MNRARILLADDHKEMRDTVEHLLESEFDIVGAVAGGEELLKAESETHPDVCVLDISMLQVSGIQAANQLKARGSSARVVFLQCMRIWISFKLRSTQERWGMF